MTTMTPDAFDVSRCNTPRRSAETSGSGSAPSTAAISRCGNTNTSGSQVDSSAAKRSWVRSVSQTTQKFSALPRQ